MTPGANVLGETFAEYDYDALGRLTLAQNAGSTVTREYDTLSQLTAEVLNGKRTELRNDGGGRLLGYTYPSGRVLNHTRDAIGRLRTIREQGASTDIALLHYSGVSTIKSRAYFNGTSATYTYDLALRTQDVTHALGGTTFARRSSTWDRQGNRITRQDPIPSPVRTFTYTYDSVARMVQSARTGGGQASETIQYALDDVGNRTSVTGGPDAGAYTLNPGHAPLNLYSTTPSGANAYYASSSLQSRANGANALAYDYRERLVRYHDVSANRLHLYFYDALGRRFKKVTDSGTAQEKETRYFFDGGWNAIEERNTQDAVVARYVYEDALDTLVEAARDPSGSGTFTTHWVHADDQRNVLALTNGAGAIVEKYEYRDYGQVLDPVTMQPITSSAVGNARLFSGREYDWDTGLYEFRHRYLDPRAGRFVSRDPIGVWGDAGNLGNAQSYCGNNPWSRVDPLGLEYSAIMGHTGGSKSGGTNLKGDTESHGSNDRETKSGERISSEEYWRGRVRDRNNQTAVTALRPWVKAAQYKAKELARRSGIEVGIRFDITSDKKIQVTAWAKDSSGKVTARTDTVDLADRKGAAKLRMYMDHFSGKLNEAVDFARTVDTTSTALAIAGFSLAGGVLAAEFIAGYAAAAAISAGGAGAVAAGAGVARPVVSHPKLANIVRDLYKGAGKPGQIGTGSTADAVRHTLRTGQLVGGSDHMIKANGYARGLYNWLSNNPNAAASDIQAARSMLTDLLSALAGR